VWRLQAAKQLDHEAEQVELYQAAHHHHADADMPFIEEEDDADAALTDQDMHDPELLGQLTQLGWEGEDQGQGVDAGAGAVAAAQDPAASTFAAAAPPAPATGAGGLDPPGESPGVDTVESLTARARELKLRAVALKRDGNLPEAREALRMSKVAQARADELALLVE